ncbi:hypothetical protein G9A89_009160 [Geosiphon pyriformis]|nr:hypothetical protein G9A89_009160 [Geosiphon pyriformis]
MKLNKSFRKTLVEAEYWTKVEKPSLLTYLTYLKYHQVSTKTLLKKKSYEQYVAEIKTILEFEKNQRRLKIATRALKKFMESLVFRRRHFSSDHLRAMANVTSACNGAPSASMLVYTDIRKSSFDS